ncbi:class I SAM-dependent methyltransferase [Crateriforma spongiae]|uniref:class I SAM-dependent methyltransferase n=1 Tax=Crateriforma spongiae TaxID=2724528 RepID=UPI001447E6B0|nr:methyltransferase domain-containing protein [Crateriforma spongiae]
MSDTLTFLKNFIRSPTQVGAIAPSGRQLVDRMTDWIKWESIRNVVEYGPGTGVFTEAIADRLHPEARFFAIERSPELAATTRQRCPGVNVVEDSASNVQALCRQHDMQNVDAILCGLPWASFPDSLQQEIMDATLAVLRPGGQFVTFAYWQGVILPAGQRFRRRLDQNFSSVHRSPTAWANLPPAFVYRCVR